MKIQIVLIVSLSVTLVSADVGQSQWMATLTALQQRMCPSPECEYSEQTLVVVSQKLKAILPQAIRSLTIQQMASRKMDQVIDACLPVIPRTSDNTFRLCDNSNQNALFECAKQNTAALMGQFSVMSNFML